MSGAMTSVSLAPIGILLLVACLIAMVSRKLGLPYIVGLVIAGFFVALLPNSPVLPLSRGLIFNIFLPPLVFEAALQLEWRRFREELPLTLTLALVGVGLAAALVAAAMHYALGWSWIGALLFGVLIAATDPVSVIASFREMRVEPRLSMLVESESLLNDGVAAVAFALLSAIAAGASTGAGHVLPEFLWTMGGGVIFGVTVSGVILLISGRTDDHLVEITLTTVAAYGSFLIAEHFRASGVIAALAAGLMVGNVGWMGAISDEGRDHVRSAWEYFAFLANSFVFILIGMNEANQPLREFGSVTAAVGVVAVLAGRLVSVYPLAALFVPSRWRVPPSYQHVLFWGGLRGALALALALAVPATVPERNQIIVTAFVVVAFSILVQGLTMPWLIKRLRLNENPSEEAVAAPAAAG
jgi:monovalent cation:H+ antiporter, CPA1 family